MQHGADLVALAVIGLPRRLGYLVVFVLVGVESAGVPVPGETALITAGVLAHRGEVSIELVIAVAAAAAIIGDNVGYLIGRTGGRRLLEQPGFLEGHRRAVLRTGEPFFARHGPKAVFLGRWVAGLRIAAAWLAGITKMPWPVFLVASSGQRTTLNVEEVRRIGQAEAAVSRGERRGGEPEGEL